MSIINSQPRIGAAGQSTGFKIERSLRFNSADSAYLNRTPASAGNRQTFTYSVWTKRSALGASNALLGVGTNTSDDVNFSFTSSDTLEVLCRVSSSIVVQLATTQVFRDVGAWYHIVVAIDTTQATSSNRVKIYVNGQQVTAFGTATYPSQNQSLAWNNNVAHEIGRVNNQFGAGQYFNGYMTEINFLDGSTPTTTTRTVGGVTETVLTQFGEFDTDTGVWKPKAYSGSYGTNGFYLKFADNSGTTSTTLGKDSSGNGNNWTPNNFYVGPGTTNAEKAGIDSLVDTPTPYGTDTGAGGEVRGNYSTVNPLDNGGLTLANGNLDWSLGAVSAYRTARSTIGMSSGKWYWEMTFTDITGSARRALSGLAKGNASLTNYVGSDANGWGLYNIGNGTNAELYNNGTSTNYGPTFTTNDVIGVAFDADNGKLWFSKNGSFPNSGDPAAGTNAGVTGLTSGPYFPAMCLYSSDGTASAVVNFGQRPFAYTAPSGFKALCTQNLPTPTIGATSATQAGKYFNTVIWTGNASSPRSITGVGFQPDFVWVKSRSNTYNHDLFDVIRGGSLRLSTNATDAEYNLQTGGYDYISSFNSDGFTATSAGTPLNLNGNNVTFAAWNWKANGAGSSNTQGTITSTVSANTTAGFSIVTYVGTGTAGTIGHGLGATPSMIIVKRRTASTAQSWQVFHSGISGMKDGYIYLNSTAAFTSGYSGIWNGTNPTSTVFSVKDDNDTNASGGLGYVAYCFAPVAGYSAFGSYTGNGSTDGPMIYTGFRPAWVLIKGSSLTTDWWLYDVKRQTYNVMDTVLYPNLSSAEASGSSVNLDILSNGFKSRSSNNVVNGSGQTYIYAAFAENPFKYSLAR